MSGGIATAIALGLFGLHGVTSAYFWCYPDDKTPAFWAFRAFRNFDGEGAQFEAFSIPAKASEGIALYASRSEDQNRVVIVAVNERDDRLVRARVTLANCHGFRSGRLFAFVGGVEGFEPPAPFSVEGGAFDIEVRPYSVNVIELVDRH